jgi:hypothetical protein
MFSRAFTNAHYFVQSTNVFSIRHDHIRDNPVNPKLTYIDGYGSAISGFYSLYVLTKIEHFLLDFDHEIHSKWLKCVSSTPRDLRSNKRAPTKPPARDTILVSAD